MYLGEAPPSPSPRYAEVEQSKSAVPRRQQQVVEARCACGVLHRLPVVSREETDALEALHAVRQELVAAQHDTHHLSEYALQLERQLRQQETDLVASIERAAASEAALAAVEEERDALRAERDELRSANNDLLIDVSTTQNIARETHGALQDHIEILERRVRESEARAEEAQSLAGDLNEQLTEVRRALAKSEQASALARSTEAHHARTAEAAADDLRRENAGLHKALAQKDRQIARLMSSAPGTAATTAFVAATSTAAVDGSSNDVPFPPQLRATSRSTSPPVSSCVGPARHRTSPPTASGGSVLPVPSHEVSASWEIRTRGVGTDPTLLERQMQDVKETCRVLYEVVRQLRNMLVGQLPLVDRHTNGHPVALEMWTAANTVLARIGASLEIPMPDDFHNAADTHRVFPRSVPGVDVTANHALGPGGGVKVATTAPSRSPSTAHGVAAATPIVSSTAVPQLVRNVLRFHSQPATMNRDMTDTSAANRQSSEALATSAPRARKPLRHRSGSGGAVDDGGGASLGSGGERDSTPPVHHRAQTALEAQVEQLHAQRVELEKQNRMLSLQLHCGGLVVPKSVIPTKKAKRASSATSSVPSTARGQRADSTSGERPSSMLMAESKKHVIAVRH